MKTTTTATAATTIGIDLGNKRHAICVLDLNVVIVDECTITNPRESLRRIEEVSRGPKVLEKLRASTTEYKR